MQTNNLKELAKVAFQMVNNGYIGLQLKLWEQFEFTTQFNVVLGLKPFNIFKSIKNLE